MPELSDEMLMAIADGETVHGGGRLPSESELTPAQRERLQIYRATRATLAEVYRRIELEPVPDRLLGAIASAPIGRRSAARESSPGLMQVIAGWFASPGVRTAFAGLAGISIGIGGMLATGTGRQTRVPTADAPAGLLRTAADGRVVAAGVLANALESMASGKGREVWDPGRAVTSVASTMTFATSSGYCRQYAFETVEASRFGGIGCRDGEGTWTIHAHFRLESGGGAQTGMRIASTSTEVLAAIVDKMSSRDALTPEEEAAVMARGWRE